jgi:phage gpG-like protein
MGDGIQKFGDWARVERMLAQAGRKLQREVGRATDRNGRLLEAAMVNRIESQQLSPGLSEKYKAWKAKHGYSEQILILTGTLIASIRYHKKDWQGGFVGVLRNVMSKGKKPVPLVNIAAVHEFGTSDGRVPARPYMAPAAVESEDQMVRNYEEAVEKVFK